MPLCFAYGSNMDRAAMAERCPHSRPVGPARLARHRCALMREGYLTVVRDPRRDVHGLLWDVPLAEMSGLDRYENVASGLYTKVTQPVLTDAGPRRALVYVGRNAGPGMARPGYLEGVLAAATVLGLPAGHLRDLEALSPGIGRTAPAPQPPRPEVTPRRRSPLDPERDMNAGWRWMP